MNSGATILDDRETVELLRDHPHLLAIADAVRATQGEPARSAFRRKPLLAAAAAVAVCATAAALVAFLVVPGLIHHHSAKEVGPRHHPTREGGSRGVALGPGFPLLHVGSAEGAQKFLPFKVVLPSNAEPLVIEVSDPTRTPARSRQLDAFFDPPATGPYEVVEGPPDHGAKFWTVRRLQHWAHTCRNRVVCPVHEISLIQNVHVLVIGAPGRPGGLTAYWMRPRSARPVLTWVQGPEDYARGDLPRHRFRVGAARAVAANIISNGG